MFHDFAIALSNGMLRACRKEWKPITPSPTERSRIGGVFRARHAVGRILDELRQHVVEHAHARLR